MEDSAPNLKVGREGELVGVGGLHSHRLSVGFGLLRVFTEYGRLVSKRFQTAACTYIICETILNGSRLVFICLQNMKLVLKGLQTDSCVYRI